MTALHEHPQQPEEPEHIESAEQSTQPEIVTIEASRRSIAMSGVVQRLSEVSRAMRNGQVDHKLFEKYPNQDDKPSVLLGHGRRWWFTGGDWYLIVDDEESMRAGRFGIRYLSLHSGLPSYSETLHFYPDKKGESTLVKERVELKADVPNAGLDEEITIHDIANEKGFHDEQKLLIRGAKLAYKFAKKHMPREERDPYL